MPWPVYSERFLHHSASGVWRYTVPQHRRAIITSIDIVNAQATNPCDVSMRVGPILSLYVAFQASWRTENRAVRTVAYSGEVIELNISHGGLHVTVSGYLMDDPSNATAPPAAAEQLPTGEELPWPESPGRAPDPQPR